MNTPFQLLQDDWIQIAPLGDFNHQMGIQRLDAEAVAQMTNRFNGFLARLGRLFSGVPLYQGHHDTDPDRYPDGKSYGWIMALDNRGKDGLWGQIKWTNDGRALVENGAFKFVSPVWDAKEVTRQAGRPVYRPQTLISLALTNNPNLPLPPLANNKDYMQTIQEILQVKADASADEIIAAVEKLRTEATTLANTATAEKTRADAEAAKIAEAQTKFEAERAARISMILDNAVTAKTITLAERTEWQGKLAKDIDAGLAELANKKPVFPTESKTKELGNNKTIFDNENTRRAELTGYLAEKQAAGLTYEQAWNLAKKEKAGLFEMMGKR